MARGHKVGLQPQGALQQQIELQPGVAGNAGIRRAPLQVITDEVIDHPMAKLLLKIEHIKRDAQPGSDPTGIAGVLLRTTSAECTPIGGRVIPHLHEDADHFIALLREQRDKKPEVAPVAPAAVE